MVRAITAVLALGLTALAGAASAQTRTAGFNVTATVIHDCQVRVSDTAVLTLDCSPGAVASVRVSREPQMAPAIPGKSLIPEASRSSIQAPAGSRPSLISIEF